MAGKAPSRLYFFKTYLMLGAVYDPRLAPHLAKPLPEARQPSDKDKTPPKAPTARPVQ